MTASVFLSIVQYHGGGRQVIRTSLAWSGVGLLAMLVLGSRWEALGVAVGEALGCEVGAALGIAVGGAVGAGVGDAVGCAVGAADGVDVGRGVGMFMQHPHDPSPHSSA